MGAGIFSFRGKVLNRMNLLLNLFMSLKIISISSIRTLIDIRAWFQGGEILLLPFVKYVPINRPQTSGHVIIIQDADKMQVPKPCAL